MNAFFRGLGRGFACGMDNMLWNSMAFGSFMPCSFNAWNFSMPIFNAPMFNFNAFNPFSNVFMSMSMPMPMMFSAPMYSSFSYPAFNYTPWNIGFDTYNFSRTPSPSSTVDTKTDTKTKVKTSDVPHYTKITEEEMQRIYNSKYDYDITTKSNLTADQINSFIDKKYPKSVLKGKGQAFIDAENTYGISALAMLGICGIETEFGTTGNAKNDSHNVVNIQRPGYNPSIHGKDRWKKYDSVDDCIMDLARILRENFVDSSGNKQVPHFKKLYQVNAKYCPASEKASQSGWAKSVTERMDAVRKFVNNK